MTADAGETTDTGVAQNARLTALTGVVLTALFIVEGVTIFDVRGMLTLHMYAGLMLIPPVLLKCGTTMYRFGAYYGGRASYVRRGAPPLVLRVLGPVVVLSTLGVLATGVWLLVLRQSEGAVRELHQACFFVWVGAMTAHFLGHALEVIREGRGEITGDRLPGRGLRIGIVAGALAAGVAVAAIAMPSSLAPWQQHSAHAPHQRSGLAPSGPSSAG